MALLLLLSPFRACTVRCSVLRSTRFRAAQLVWVGACSEEPYARGCDRLRDGGRVVQCAEGAVDR